MIPQDWPSLLDVIAGGGATGTAAAAGYFAGKWFLEWTSGRMDKKEARLDQIQEKVLSGLLADVERLKQDGASIRKENGEIRTENGEMRTEIRDLREKLSACEHQHAEANGKIVALEGIIQAAGIARQQAQQIRAADQLGE